jgi:toxin ParE1/3/4
VAYKILFTQDALADLERILDYIRADNPGAAERFGNALLDHVEILKTFPKMGVLVRKRSGVRKILHSPIRIYYRFHEDQGLVEILRFWHGARKEPKKP